MTRLRGNSAIVLALVGLLLCFGLPEIGIGGAVAPGDGIGSRVLREGIWWAFGATIVLWVVRVERLPLSSIGLKRPRWSSLGWALAAAVLMLASVMLSYAVIIPAFGLTMNHAATRGVIAAPLWLQTMMMIRAGVVEEILYRGYPIERIEWLTGSRWIAGLAAAAVFVIAHLAYWGAAQLIVVAFGAAILTALYLWRRDLVANMIAHVLTDLVGFMLARMQGG
jgi:membrane protease YdiL (CAAX protease family)